MPDEEHEDTPDSDDRIDFTRTPPVPTGKPLPVPAEPQPTVGVREPRVPVPKPLALAAGLPTPVAETPLPDVVGVPPPAPGRVDLGKVTAGTKSVTVRSIMREAEASIGRSPARAEFSEADSEFLRNIGVHQGSVASPAEENRLAGQARSDAIQSQMAEEAAAEAFAPRQTQQLEVMRDLVHRPPAPLVAIPLLAEAFRLLRRSPVFRSAVPITPGRIGTAGRIVPADVAPRSTPLVTRSVSRPPSGPGQMSEARGAGGMFFNAAERMRRMTGVARRSVQQADPFGAPVL